MDEEKEVREKREGQLTKEPREGSRQRRAEEDGRIEIAVQGKDVQQKEAEREDSQRWVSIPCGFVEVSRKKHIHDSLQMRDKLHKIVTQTLLSCAGNWPKSILFVCSSFHPLGCILYGRYEMCDKPLDESLAMNRIGLKQLVSRGAGRVVSHPKTIRNFVKISNLMVAFISCNNSKIKYISETSKNL